MLSLIGIGRDSATVPIKGATNMNVKGIWTNKENIKGVWFTKKKRDNESRNYLKRF